MTALWVDMADGLRGYYARPESAGPHPAVLVFIEAFGVNGHFEELAGRLAGQGYCALVPDIYHGKTYSYDDTPNAIGHLKTLRDDTVMAEAGQALDWLACQGEVAQEKTAVLGFCMGGRLAFLANAAHARRLKAAVAFYGGGIAPEKDAAGRLPLLDRIPAMQAPLLLLYGAKDGSILPGEHGRIAAALSTANKTYSLCVFPDAGHGFFCDQRKSYHADAAARAWTLALEHLHAHLS